MLFNIIYIIITMLFYGEQQLYYRYMYMHVYYYTYDIKLEIARISGMKLV